MIEKKLVMNHDMSGKRVLLRSCLNVTMSPEGEIQDETRLVESLPAIAFLSQSAKQLIVLAHLWRPTAPGPQVDLLPVAREIEQRTGQAVYFAPDLSEATLARIRSGADRLVVLQNIRYFPGEESKNPEEQAAFCDLLASLGDVFVNDAFADYRPSVSTYHLAKRLPSYLGPKFAQEVAMLSAVWTQAEHPVVAVIGGSKLSEKLLAIEGLLQIADTVIIAWAMASTLVKAQGGEIGTSLHEPDKLDMAKALLDRYGDAIVLPVDRACIREFADPTWLPNAIHYRTQLPADEMSVDIGPHSQELFGKLLAEAKTIIWNGPVGVYEWEATRIWSEYVARAIGKNIDAFKLSGWGDCLTLINMLWYAEVFNHLCTGGGAMLSWFADTTFPVLDVIMSSEEIN